jgi:LmbE family N-acetylglucosaminyl deacetylase
MSEEQLDVIAVGAHPDDLEITCGGTIAKLVRQGYRVGMIDLTDGPSKAGYGRRNSGRRRLITMIRNRS